MTSLLLYGAPDASPDLFHAIPAGIVDPFLYAEVDGRRAATVSVLDADKVRAQGIEILDPYQLGADELLDSGRSRHEVDLEITLRACRELERQLGDVSPANLSGDRHHRQDRDGERPVASVAVEDCISQTTPCAQPGFCARDR
jgi:hypothetical protein